MALSSRHDGDEQMFSSGYTSRRRFRNLNILLSDATALVLLKVGRFFVSDLLGLATRTGNKRQLVF